MKKVLFVVVALVSCIGMGFASNPFTTNNLQDVLDAKDAAITFSHLTPGQPVGGEDIANAVVIPSVPFLDGGDTGLYLDNYDEACPYTGSTSPDVVYAFTPTTDMGIEISLCNSQYDTKVYVYEDVAGNLVACNDDYCSNAYTSFASFIECFEILAGHTYYIVVDGYGGASGIYEIDIQPCDPPVPCDPICPPNAIVEGEVDCYTDYVDATNGGCNSIPAVFTDIACNGDPTVVCGTTGNYLYNGFSYRDTDWYRISWAGGTMKASICANFSAAVGVIDAICPVTATLCFETSTPPFAAECELALPAGDYYIFASTAAFYGVPCGSDYVLTIEGCPSTATEENSWGGVKTLFR